MINLYIDINSINILFVGDSGSGKSTLADIIIKDITVTKKRITVVIYYILIP